MRNVYRVEWMPGGDRLLATCFCGATRVIDGPAAAWDWLHGHPSGHPADGTAGAGTAPSAPSHRLPAGAAGAGT
jgi:hypothetical protein